MARWFSLVLAIAMAAAMAACNQESPSTEQPDRPASVTVLWTTRAHAGPVRQVALEAGLGLLATADGGGRVELYDAVSLTRVDAGSMHHHPGKKTVAFSPDGAWLATGAYGGVRVWDVEAEALSVELAPATDGAADALAWSPDGQYLAASRRPGRGGPGEVGLVVWRVATAQLVASIEVAGWIGSVAWSDDGSFVAVGHGSVTVYATDSWTVVVSLSTVVAQDTVRWHPGLAAFMYLEEGAFWSIEPALEAIPILQYTVEDAVTYAVHPTTHELAVGTSAGIVLVVTPDGVPGPVLATHAKAVTSLAWDGDGDALISASSSGNVKRTALSTGASVSARLGHGRSYAVTWSPDDATIATGGDDGAIRLWNADSAAQLSEVYAHGFGVSALGWHPTEQIIASLGDDVVRLWNADDLSLERETWFPRYYSDTDLAWRPDGEQLALAGGIWVDIRLSADLSLVEQLTHGSTAIAWSDDGVRLALGSWWVGGDNYRPAEIVNLNDGTSIPLALDDWSTMAMAWSGDRIAAGTFLPVIIWDAVTGAEVERVPVEGNRRITSLAWSPNGRYLAVGSDCDYTTLARVCVVVWDSNTDAVIPVFDHASLSNTAGEVRWNRAGDRLAATDWSGRLAVASFNHASD